MKNKDPKMLIIETFNNINSISLSGPGVLALFENSGLIIIFTTHYRSAHDTESLCWQSCLGSVTKNFLLCEYFKASSPGTVF